MSKIETIRQILVIRNDSTTNWEQSSYILRKGELGIAWLETDNEKKPIVKVGDGSNIWNNLPQSEYVFEEDLIITHSFGRHIVEKDGSGNVNAGGKNMTVSEWLIDALIASQAPIIIQPTFEFGTININTDTGNYEIGSMITTVDWETKFNPGFYQFGSYIEGQPVNSKMREPILTTIYAVDYNGESVWGTGETEAPNGAIEISSYIEETGDINLGTIKAKSIWSDAENIPVTNRAEPYLEGRIKSNEWDPAEITYMASYHGYREGCFYGVLNEEVTAENIRSLERTGDNYKSGTEIKYTIEKGSKKLVIACPVDSEGLTSVYNTSVNAEMFIGDNFDKMVMQIPGANGQFPIDYNIYVYEPAEAYNNATNITITLGEKEVAE